MKEAFELLELIEASSGTNDKKAFIAAGADNEVFKSILKWTYDSSLVFNIKKIPQRGASSSESNDYKCFSDALSNLAEKKITGDDAKRMIEFILLTSSYDEYKWYSKILQKDLRIGIGVKLINSAIPDLIPVFQAMLATKFEKYPDDFIMQVKVDGVRALYNTSTATLHTRNGKVLEGYDDIIEAYKDTPAGYMIDGELAGIRNSNSISNSNFQSTMMDVFRKSDHKEGVHYVFDAIPLGDFWNGRCEMPLMDRIGELYGIHPRYSNHVRMLNFTKNMQHSGWKDYVNEFYTSALEKGYEGIMIKDAYGAYECKRSKLWQKMKLKDTFDLQVIGINYGDPMSKYDGMVGSLICNFDGVEVGVGSGLSDAQRKEWAEDTTLIVGKIVEVEAQEVTENLKETQSLRFPVLKSIREDL